MLNNLDALRTAYENVLKDAERENVLAAVIAGAFEETPARILFIGSKMPWVIYRPRTFQKAVEMASAFSAKFGGLLPFSVAKDGSCTVVGPWEYIDKRFNDTQERYAMTVEYEGTPYFEVLAGTKHSTTTFVFHARVNEVLVKVAVDLLKSPITARVVPQTIYGKKSYRKEYPDLSDRFDQIRWGMGDDAVQVTYMPKSESCYLEYVSSVPGEAQ